MKIRLSRTLRSTARFSLPLTSAIVALFSSHSAIAGNTWDGTGGTGFWNTPANWNGDTLPSSASALIFSGNVQNITTNNLTADSSFLGINFNNTGAANNTSAFTLAGNRITLGGNIVTANNTAGTTITDIISLDMILDGNRTITTGQQNASVQHNLTISGIISETGGARTLTKSGGGTLILSGANTYTGATTLGTGGSLTSGGLLTISGTAGTINASSGYTINGSGSRLLLDNTAGNVDRLNNTSSVNLNLGGELSLTGNASSNSTETIAGLTLGSGSSIVTVDSPAGRVSTLAVTGGITRDNFSTALVRGTLLDQSAGTGVSRITLGSAPSGANFVGTTTLNNGSVTDATKALKIVPWLIGDTTTNGTGKNFVTYDSTLGLRVLNATEMDTLSAGSTTAANPVNALAFNGTVTAPNLTVNSLLFNTTGQTLNGSGALTVNSGAVASVVGAGTIGSGFGSLVLGNGEGVLTATTGALTINTPVNVTSSGGLTKSGASTVVLGASNLYTGQTTVNQGALMIGIGTAGDLGSNTANIVLNGGNLSFGRSNAGLTLANTISGSGAVTQSGTGTTVLSGANTYTGTTTVSAGTLTLSGNRTVNTTGDYSVSGAGTQTLNIQGGNYGIGGSFVVGNSGGTATVNHSAGTISGVGVNGLIMGNGSIAGTRAIYNLSGGSLTSANIGMGINPGASAANRNTSEFNVSGGTLAATTLRIGNYTAANSFNTTNNFTQTGGTTTVTTLGLGGNSANALNSTGAVFANLNLTGGTFTATNIASLSAGGAASASDANSSSINIGGTAQVTLGTFGSIVKGQNSTATITFDSGAGGFLAPVTNSATYMPTGTFTRAFLTANGANFNVGTGKDITIGQVLENASGAAGTLTKSGAGILTLSGNNTYTGATTVSAGTLAYGVDNALSTGDVTVNGGTLALSNFSDSVGTVTLTSGNITGNTGVLTSTGTFEMQSGSVSAILGGTAALNKTTSGTVTLSKANTYSGGTTVSAGTLELGNGGSVLGNITNNATFSINRTDSSTLGNVISGTGALTKSGVGVLTLSGNNTYTGATTVSAGTLAYGVDNALSTGAVTVNGGTLALSNFSDSVGTVTLTSGNITGNTGVLTSTGTFEMQSGSVSAILDGTAALNKTTSGTVILSKANTYSGGTTVSAGTLELGNGGSVSGNITNNASFTINRTDSSTLGNVISGTGALFKTGTGEVTLSGENTYTGATTVTGGTLTLSGNRTTNTTGAYNVTGAGTQTLNIQNGNYTIGLNFVVGSTNGTATVNHSAGTIRVGGGGLIMGNGPGNSTSFYNLSGGSLTTDIIMGSNSGTSAAAPHTSTINVSGTGALTVGALRIGRYDTAGVFNTTSTFNQTAGTTTVSILGLGGNSANAANSAGPLIANLNLTGGTFTATNIQSISAGGATTVQNANSSFINIGGTAQVTLGAFPTARGSNSTAFITFDTTTGGGGFLAPVAASATYMNAGTFTSAFLTANGANFNVGSGKDITIGQVLENASGAAGTLTKSGAGVLTLSGNNTYTGATTLSAGTLSVGTIGNGGEAGNLGAATSEASNLVFAGGALRYTGGTASSDRSFTMTNAAVNSINVSNAASTLTLTGRSPANTGLLQKDGAGGLTLDPGAGNGYSLGSINANGGTLTLKSGTFTTTGIYPTSVITGYDISAGARNGGTLTVDGAALTVAPGGARRFVIGGAASGTGNLLSGSITADTVVIGHNATATMTQSGGELTTGDLFHNDGGIATYTMTNGTLTARSITYRTSLTNSSGNSFTFSMNGGTVRAASDTGTNNLFANNTSTGTLQMAVQLGTNGATIDTSLSSARIVRPLDNISGQAGTLTKIGANTLTLLGTNTYTGATTVSAGTLLVETGASVAASASIVNGGLLRVNGTAGRVTVNSGGSLGGSGTVGAVTLTRGSLLNPGNSPGLLTASEATWAAGSTYQWEIDNATGEAGDNWDLFSVTGALDMSALSSNSKMNLVLESLSLENYSTTTPFSWTIAKAGSFTGTGWDDGTNVTDLFNINATAFNGGNLPNNGFKVEVGTSGDLRTLNLMAIPEPNTRTLFLAGSLVGLMALRRRRA